MNNFVTNLVYLLSILLLAAGSGTGAGSSSNRKIYTLDANAYERTFKFVS